MGKPSGYQQTRREICGFLHLLTLLQEERDHLLRKIARQLGAMRAIFDLPELQMRMGITGIVEDCRFCAFDGGLEIFLGAR
jgi:hypothetical protein